MWAYGKGKLREIGLKGIFAGRGLLFLKDSLGAQSRGGGYTLLGSSLPLQHCRRHRQSQTVRREGLDQAPLSA